MEKHTPGPWRTEGNRIVSNSPHMSADVADVCARFGSDTARADARLIAAAPELLATCRLMLHVLEVNDLDPVDVNYCSIRERAEQAIAKAGGR